MKEPAYYQSLINILTWIVELGWIYICLEVSMTSSHLALPRMGHLDQVTGVAHIYDPNDPVVNPHEFELRDWAFSEFGY